jgi:hypothetical protein
MGTDKRGLALEIIGGRYVQKMSKRGKKTERVETGVKPYDKKQRYLTEREQQRQTKYQTR